MKTPPNTPERQAGRRSPCPSRGALGATLVLLALAPAAGALAPAASAASAASATITVLGPASGGYAETGAGVLPPLAGVTAADSNGSSRPASAVAPRSGGVAAGDPNAAAPARSLVAPARAVGGTPTPVVVAAGSLPYTGLDLWVLLAAAAGLIGTGLALRRAGRAPGGRRHSS